MYYRNAQAAVVVYDVTKAASLEKAKSWVKELQRQANPNIVIALAGNKVDLVSSPSVSGPSSSTDAEDEPDDATATPGESPAPGDESESLRQVPKEEAQAYATEAGLLFFETSAKTGEGVVPLFTEIGMKLLYWPCLIELMSRQCSEEDSHRAYLSLNSKQRTKWRSGWEGRRCATRGQFGGERAEGQGCMQLLILTVSFYRVVCLCYLHFNSYANYEIALFLFFSFADHLYYLSISNCLIHGNCTS
jgi:hypothetical protein